MKISRTLLNKIEAEALAAYPKEACGLLVGRPGGDEIVDAIPSCNLASGEDEFLIDPKVHIKAQRELREQELAVIGVYHSHTSGDSAPSRSDKISTNLSDFWWLIVALKGQKITDCGLFCAIKGKFAKNERNFVREDLQIEENPV